MESVKLSELDQNCEIVSGSRNELGYAGMLYFRIYSKMKYPKKNKAIIDGKYHDIIIDVKKEDIYETLVCSECGLDVGINAERCPNHKPIYIDGELYEDWLEYKYLLKSKVS